MFLGSVKDTGNSYIIRNFPREHFARKLKKHYKTTKLNKLFKAVGVTMFANGSIKVHKFFVPELLYLLDKFNYPGKLINEIVDNTWVKYIGSTDFKNRVDLKRVKANMRVKLLPWQQEFLETYDIERQRYMLNGYILAFDQGLGKTITSLSVMEALGKKKVIIFAPNSTLETVWEKHIEQFFIQKKKVCIVNRDNLDPEADFFIFNYESMGKVREIEDSLDEMSKDIGIIVDESHNFLRKDSKRTQNLISIRESLGCEDVLLMSGTPVKAIGIEIMPMLMILDQFIDDEALQLYKNAFGVNTTIAADVLRARLSTMMHRRTKDELLKLPLKQEITQKVKIPNGDSYTLDKVKNAVSLFVDQRFSYHEARMDQYNSDFLEVMQWLRDNGNLSQDDNFTKYLALVNMMRNSKVDMRDPETSKNVQWVNQYERDVLVPLLPANLKKQFNESKSAVKYLHLKIRGEVIGQLLMQLRMQMTTEIMENSNLENIINDSFKKTVVFTSYTDTVEAAEKYLKNKNFKPLLVYGKTSNDTKKLLDTFDKDVQANPLVASLKSLSTGVTLTVANTVVFLNKPWRHVDYLQASDRVHRIGQDSQVFIISIVLDTGDKDNLSTRMESVMEWSKTMFTELVGETDEENN